MKRMIGLVVAVSAVSVAPVRAQGQCAPTPSAFAVVTPSSKIAVTLLEHTAVIVGTSNAKVEAYDYAIFRKGEDPNVAVPTTSVSLTKAQFTLQAGTANCYEAKPSVLFGVASDVEYVSYLRAKRTVVDPATGPWSAPSNPFGVPSALTAPSGLTVIP